MANREILLDHRHLILLVGAFVVHLERLVGVRRHVGMRLAALGDEPVGGFQILLVAGRAIELHQRELDLLVTRHGVASVRAKRVADEIGVPDRYVEERPLAGRFKVRDTRFNQVAGVIVFMLFHIGPAFI